MTQVLDGFGTRGARSVWLHSSARREYRESWGPVKPGLASRVAYLGKDPLGGLFDDVLSGTVSLVGGRPVVTGRLRIRYRQATPIEADLRFEAWVDHAGGRRVLSRARCLVDGTVTAEAEALFVVVAQPEAT